MKLNNNEELDEITAIQLIALKNYEHPDQIAYFRRLARWFSKEFATNYFEVIEKMTFHELLLQRYEYNLENSDSLEIGKIKRQLLYDKEVAEVEAEDDDWVENEIKQLKAEEIKLKESQQKQVEEISKNLPEINMKF